MENPRKWYPSFPWAKQFQDDVNSLKEIKEGDDFRMEIQEKFSGCTLEIFVRSIFVGSERSTEAPGDPRLGQGRSARRFLSQKRTNAGAGPKRARDEENCSKRIKQERCMKNTLSLQEACTG